MIPHRKLFWEIQEGWLFYILAAVAVGIFTVGLIRHISVWTRGLKNQDTVFSANALIPFLVDGFFGRRIFKGDIAAGIMHLSIMGGFLLLFLGTVVLAVDHYIIRFLTGQIYLTYSAVLEIAGLMLLLGIFWALIRRYVQRISRLENRLEDLGVLLWLMLAALTGFLVEGSRLAAQAHDWVSWSFFGFILSWTFKDAPQALTAYPFLWWTHAILSLGLIAVIPFSKLFHVLAAPTSIYFNNKEPKYSITETDEGQGEESFSFRERLFLDSCTRCGRCVEVCPSAGAGEPFSPRDFILSAKEEVLRENDPFKGLPWPGIGPQKIRAQDRGIDPDQIWYCTTCRACLEICPVYTSTPDAVRKARGKFIEEGLHVPALLIQTLEKLYKYNNPWESSKKNRAEWSKELEVQHISSLEQPNGLCYFVGCTTSLDTRAQGIARSFVSVLKHAGLSFGTLGKKEPCCGDIARRVGETGLFQEQMEECLELLSRYGVKDMVTSSPHCFNAMRNEYSAASKAAVDLEDLKVRHYSQLLWELLARGRLTFEKTLNIKVTYHDPCYLGRYNRVFQEPRDIIKAIPGVEMLEMEHNRADSLCCGGGGGRMWQDELDVETKMSEVRVREAAATGADVLITACPLCLIMLEDARKTEGLEDQLEIMDLNELTARALGLEPE